MAGNYICKLIIIGALLLVAGIAAHYLMDIEKYGFWIGTFMGSGSILIITGVFKKMN